MAQLDSYYHPSTSGSSGGFLANVFYRNINSYSDPSIISLRMFTMSVSQRVKDYCTLYDIGRESCTIAGVGGSANRIQGNVQTGAIPLGNSFWLYQPGIDEDSCVTQCSSRRFDLGGFGILGCQAPFPTPDFYAGRTCAADGYDGWLSIALQFHYADYNAYPGGIPEFTFEESDVYLTAVNTVRQGPSGFQPTSTPEPSTWILMATGMAMIATMARRRPNHAKKIPTPADALRQ
ncbi:MAG: PEP-CTERM sorting domain-containing protein [Gemmatimonadaceae bacterium]